MKLLRVLALLAITLGANAQATLPTSWDFNGAAPAGWSTSGTNTYASAGLIVDAPSCKLDGTGDYILINVADDPGNVKYYIRGSIGGPISSWVGTFSVQESVNGTTWTPLKTYTNNLTWTGEMVADSVTPNVASRYIRFYYTDKQPNANVAIDNVSIKVGPPSPAQNINVQYNGVDVPIGGTIYISSPVATSTQFNLTVQNTGSLNTLTVTDPTFSGPQQNDFIIVNSYPLNINASSNNAVSFSFNPPVAGTRLAQISIPSNDANENPYTINIYATGGNFATEPTAQPTAITFPVNKTYRVKGQFTAASQAVDGGYLVLRKTGSAVTELPVDGTSYSVGDYIGNAQVISKGQATSFIPKNIIANNTYHFAVFSYNGVGTNTNYLTASPLIGQATTPATAAIGNYYAGINKNLPSFVTSLSAKINPHNSVFYGNYDEIMINLFASRDTSNGQHVVTCAYTSFEYVYDDPFTYDVISREHTFCHSWMPTFNASTPTEKPEYNDMHNLYPVQFEDANQPRSDNPLGIVVSANPVIFLDGKFGLDANGILVYEPRDEHKGRAARAIMYMSTCYNGIAGKDWSIPYITTNQNINLLKEWHFQFPPNEWDIARNDFIDSVQNNRNPFVDSVDFACYIDFRDMSYISNPTPATCLTTEISENNSTGLGVNVYPIPSNGTFNVSVTAEKTQPALVLVTDYAGRIVMQKRISVAKGANLYEINLGGYDSGIYNLSIRSDIAITTKRLVLVN